MVLVSAAREEAMSDICQACGEAAGSTRRIAALEAQQESSWQGWVVAFVDSHLKDREAIERRAGELLQTDGEGWAIGNVVIALLLEYQRALAEEGP